VGAAGSFGLAHYFQVVVVYGHSMEPTMTTGDRLIVFKTVRNPTFLGFRIGNPISVKLHNGHLIVMNLPYGPPAAVIKRIVAGPGDTLSVRNAGVHINGAAVHENYLDNPKPFRPPGAWHVEYLLPDVSGSSYAATGHEWGPMVIPPGRYFVLGDNRDRAGDSRLFGLVNIDDILGVVLWHL
jgi:signal peptidase I